MNNKRKIPLKNYFLLAGIYIFTLMGVLYLGSWYKMTTEYKKDNSPVLEIINEISINELDSYLIDKPSAVIYMSAYNDDLYLYELDLIRLIRDYNLKSEIVYINLNDSDLKEIDKYYSSKKYYKDNLVIFENGKIEYFLATNREDLTKEKTLKFLIEHEMID